MNKLVFMFPGQGSQYVGMGKALYESHPEARSAFEEAGAALGFDLAKLVFEGPAEELTLTANAQPALLTVGVAAYRVFARLFGAVPFAMAGHSLGEITALSCAGAIPFDQAVAIVHRRGELMQEAVQVGAGAMAAVNGASEEAVRQACEEASKPERPVVISNYNSPDQIVISGRLEGVREAGETLKKQGAIVIPLKVSAPFHSPLMQPAADRFREELARYPFQPLQTPVFSNVTAGLYESHLAIADSLSTQMVRPVRWTESMREAVRLGADAFVELGPQAVLCGLLGRIAPEARAFAYDKKESADRLAEWLAGSPSAEATGAIEKGRPVERKRELSLLARCLAAAVCTKNRGDDSAEYEAGVVRPYREIAKLHEELESRGERPSREQEELALRMLGSVFEAKRTPAAERESRFGQILEETGRAGVWNGYVQQWLLREG